MKTDDLLAIVIVTVFIMMVSIWIITQSNKLFLIWMSYTVAMLYFLLWYIEVGKEGLEGLKKLYHDWKEGLSEILR